MKLGVLLQCRNRFIYISLSLVFLLLVRENLWYIVVLIAYGYYIYKNHFDIFVIIIVVFVIYLSRIVIFSFLELEIQSKYDVEVISDIERGDYTNFLGKVNGQYVLMYFDGNIDVKPGEVYLVSGNIDTPIASTIPHGFDYQKYLFSRNIKYTMFSEDYELKSKKMSLGIIFYYLDQYITKHCPKSQGYIKTFILADQSDIDDIFLRDVRNIGISHLFSVSGLHIALIVLVLEQILKRLKLKPKFVENSIIIILLLYLIITNYAPSITRATFMYIFLVVNKRVNLKLSSLDILSIILLLLLIIKPYYYYNIGFVLSFLVTTALIIGNGLLKDLSKMKQLFGISLLAFFITFPIIVNLNYQINLLSLVFNVAFLIYVTYIILPLGYVTFFFPFLDSFYHLFIRLFESFVNIASDIQLFEIEMYFSNPVYYIVYYVLLIRILILVEGRQPIKFPVYSMLILLFIIYMSPFFRVTQDVVFIDVEGDSALISDRFNKCNILVDTGETDEYDAVIHYLKSRNIKRIDYVIISHFHSDHFGEVEDVLTQFKVMNLITNQNIKNYDNRLTSCGNIDFFIYDLSYNDTNENNNSIIFSLFISDKHYLFVGDAEAKREQEFMEKFNVQVDYLKVGHHGSNTSSTIEFIKHIYPEYAVISVGRNNTFGHPCEEIVQRYQDLNINLSRTDINGTIIFRYFFTKEYKRVHSP